MKDGGGYHTNTVAEDADLTMNLLEQGYSVIYEDRALAFTEAPVNMDGLMRQRFRWSFGILQAVFKHRGAIANRRAMGLFALPNTLIFQILLPLVSPLIDLMFVASLVNYFYDKHFHPEAASPASLIKLLVFFVAFIAIDFAASALAFTLERKHPASKGDAWLLFHIWIQRFTYRQGVLDCALQDHQARHRWQTVQLGQAGSYGDDVEGDREADAGLSPLKKSRPK